MEATVIITALGIVASCVAGLIWVIKNLFEKILPTLDQLTKSTIANTDATKSADSYLKVRNGRDSEMHKELIKSINAIPEQIIKTATVTAKTLKENPEQKVINQNVDMQHVAKIIVDKKVP